MFIQPLELGFSSAERRIVTRFRRGLDAPRNGVARCLVRRFGVGQASGVRAYEQVIFVSLQQVDGEEVGDARNFYPPKIGNNDNPS